MSGPWDRASSDEPDGPWPREDLEAARPGDGGLSRKNSWSRSEPRDAAIEGAPGWDDWPPPPPPPDDYYVEDPIPPSSDPWAESWTDEALDAERVASPEPRRVEARPAETATRQTPSDPEPSPPEPWGATASPEPTSRDAAVGRIGQPRVEPWAPDPDPWQIDEVATKEHSADTVEPIAPEIDERGGKAGEATPTDSGPAPTEPSSEAKPADSEEAAAGTAPEEGAADVDEEAEASAVPRSFWRNALAWLSPSGRGTAPQREPEPEAEPASEPESAPREAETAAQDGRPVEGGSVADDAAPAEPILVPAPEPGVWPDRDREPAGQGAVEMPAEEPAADGGGEVQPTAGPAESSRDRRWEPDEDSTAGSGTASRAADEPWWGGDGWSERATSTQVLPTSWTPHTPEPRAPGDLEPSAGEMRTGLADREPDLEDEMEPAPSMAEQAVPWLIGVILLLAGMVIVLLALIFAGDASLGGAAASADPTLAAIVEHPTPSPSPSPSPTPSATPPPTPSVTPTAAATGAPVASATPTATPEPSPAFGALEMVYQGRSAALAPIYLLRRDFTVDEEPTVLAQDASFDVGRFAWAPDGTVGAGLLADVLVSVEPGTEKRRLGDGVVAVSFGDDAAMVYAVRVTQDGGSDVATVLAIDFASGDTEELAAVTYARPPVDDRHALREAQFADDGGAVRLYWMENDVLRLWSFGAGSWDIDPADGQVTERGDMPVPQQWSPDGRQQIALSRDRATTTLTLVGRTGREGASVSVEGLVSHLRWSPRGDMVVFTLGRTASGGVLQDLFVWYLEDGEAPMQLTSTGAAFGAEWLGAQPRWSD